MLDATLSLLSERGYEFSVDDVAARARVHKTTIYRRWDTKPALVAAAIEQLAADNVVVPHSEDPVGDLRDLAVQVARVLHQPAGINALRAALSTASTEPELSTAAARFLATRYAMATPPVRQAQLEGTLRPELGATLVWQAMVNPLHLNAVTEGSIDDTTAIALVDLVLDGARRRQPAPVQD